MTRSNREFEQVSLEEQLFYRYFRPAKEKEDGEWLSPADVYKRQHLDIGLFMCHPLQVIMMFF